MAFIVECCACNEKQMLMNNRILQRENIKVLISPGVDGYVDIDLICKKCGNSIESDNGL